MIKALGAALLVCGSFFFFPRPILDGSEALAAGQFDNAKAAFEVQRLYLAQRWARLAFSNAPRSAAPLVLIGHCFYLQGQDPAARYYYAWALRVDPSNVHLPPFWSNLPGPASPPLSLPPSQLAGLRRKIGQMIMVSVPGTRLTGQKRTLLREGWIGGVILFSQNIQTKAQVRRYIAELQRNSPTPLFVALDQEGGAVRRLKEAQGFQRLPSLAALGETHSPDLAYRFGLLSGRQLREVGANLNLAPVVDLERTGVGDAIIAKYRRSLGSDPVQVSDLARQIVRGMRAEDIIATAKHFPSETEAADNPHQGMAVADATLSDLENRDMVPYRDLIADRTLDAVMLSHVIYRNVDPYFPASLSSEMIQTQLRRRLGFKGLVISDDLRMNAIRDYYPLEISVVQAVNAGVDVLLVTDNLEKRVMDALVEGVERGKIPEKTIDEAYDRIMATKVKYGIVPRQGGVVLRQEGIVPCQGGKAPVTAPPSNSPIRLAQKP